MPAYPPALLLPLLLLSGPALAVPCLTGAAPVELPAVPSQEAPRVCISPGQVTMLSFDGPILPQSVTLEGGERFAQVEEGRSMLKLVPSERVHPGEQLHLTVRFADGAAPSSAALVLVVHAGQAASLVEVYRRTRPVESYQRELKAKEEEARQLREENARLRAETSAPGGLAGLFFSGILDDRRWETVSTNITLAVAQPPGSPVEARVVLSYRMGGRVAVALQLDNPEGTPWMAEGSTLTLEGRRGQGLEVLMLWQAAPAAGVMRPWVVVEAEAPSDGARGPYTLTLWEAGGTRRVTLGDVMLP